MPKMWGRGSSSRIRRCEKGSFPNGNAPRMGVLERAALECVCLAALLLWWPLDALGFGRSRKPARDWNKPDDV